MKRKDLIKLIHGEMKIRGYSQADMAVHAKVNHSTVQKFLANKQDIKLSTVVKLLNVVDHDLEIVQL